MFSISSTHSSISNNNNKPIQRGNSLDDDEQEFLLQHCINNNSSCSSSSSSSSSSTSSVLSVVEVHKSSDKLLEEVAASLDSQLGTTPPAVIQSRDEAKMQRRRRKKKRLAESLSTTTFKDIYYLTGDVLGEGSYGRVETCINQFTDIEYAVKIISKKNWCFSRSKVLKEVELYYLCQGKKDIIQLVEYFEESHYFYLIFEKAHGGPLLSQIQRRVKFTEREAAECVQSLAKALHFLHERGIAHRDLKPENILCASHSSPLPIKLCDFDLCSSVNQTVSTPLLQSPVGSAEYMAPEVVQAFAEDNDLDYDLDDLTYDKRCDLWSLGVIAYILLCGYLPFSGRCDDANCGWEKGGECQECQTSLFSAIKANKLTFPQENWAGVSEEAKDLISRLLVKEASLRLDAASILRHPWISGEKQANNLETPVVLRRQTSSVKELFSPEFAVFKTMKRSATELNMEGGPSEAIPIPLRKVSMNQNHRKVSRNNNMRRQTSLIFNRCEY